MPLPDIDAWFLKAIAASVGQALEMWHGREPFYPPEAVLAACQARNLPDKYHPYAIAMFVAPEDARETLAHYGIADPAAEIRGMMVQKISSGDTGDPGCIGSPAYDFLEAYSFHDLGATFHAPLASDLGGDGGGSADGGGGGGGDA